MARKTASELWRDALIRHQVYLMRSAGTLRRMIVDLLAESEKEIRTQINNHSSKRPVASLKLLADVAKLRKKAFSQVDKRWLSSLIDLTEKEPTFLSTTLKEISPIALQLDRMTKPQVQQVVKTSTVMGKTAQEWFDALVEKDVDRITTQIRLAEERGSEQTKLLLGLFGPGGQSARTNRDVETLLLTLVLGLTSQVRAEYFAVNSDIVDYWRFVAVLDSHTTILCRSLSNRKFPMGKGPWPPLHWRCRSTGVPIIRGFGPEPEEVSYSPWLRTQPVAFQNEILGVRRGELFRKGGLNLDRFVDYNTYHQYTLDELAIRESEAFRRAFD